MTNEIKNIPQTEIVLYQPDESTRLEVRLEDDTVWLTQAQMSELFQTTRNNITLHIRNVFKEGELSEISVCKESLLTASDGKRYNTKFYNLDVIISVGYRVKSQVGVRFRQWATRILKQHLLHGYSINHQLVALQQHVDERFLRIEDKLQQHDAQLDFFIRTNTPPAEMVFFNGDFFTARVALEQLIKTAKQRAIIIDPYVDAKTFDILDARAENVLAEIYTSGVGQGMIRLRDAHNRQPNVQPIEIYKWRNESHDRWLIIDDSLYHCGHSLNAMGNKMSAITLMGISPDVILSQVR
ncbi:MAG: virulence RhuM family protein [Bacteroidaceae bacterium]|nr:virulence RhuM family protein [Bacteroidaceae bacterium]